MGHPEPFDLRIVAIGNEECGMSKYQGMLSLFDFFSLVNIYIFRLLKTIMFGRRINNELVSLFYFGIFVVQQTISNFTQP